MNAALALNAFHDDAGGPVADRFLQRGAVVGRNELHSRQQRLEVLAVLLLTGDGDGAERPPVEVTPIGPI